MVNEKFTLFFCNRFKGPPVQRAMPHFYFHLQHGKARTEDSSGIALPDAEAAWYQAYRNARDLILAEAPEGRPWDGEILEVVDEQGGPVWAIPICEIAELAT